MSEEFGGLTNDHTAAIAVAAQSAVQQVQADPAVPPAEKKNEALKLVTEMLFGTANSLLFHLPEPAAQAVKDSIIPAAIDYADSWLHKLGILKSNINVSGAVGAIASILPELMQNIGSGIHFVEMQFSGASNTEKAAAAAKVGTDFYDSLEKIWPSADGQGLPAMIDEKAHTAIHALMEWIYHVAKATPPSQPTLQPVSGVSPDAVSIT